MIGDENQQPLIRVAIAIGVTTVLTGIAGATLAGCGSAAGSSPNNPAYVRCVNT